jgi:hypothetical protein
MMPVERRWLNPSDCAAYIGARVDQLPRLLREGKLPKPSLHLGPRRPRYDREAIDTMFAGTGDTDIRREQAAAVAAIIAEARLKRESRVSKTGRRLDPPIRLRPQDSGGSTARSEQSASADGRVSAKP